MYKLEDLKPGMIFKNEIHGEKITIDCIENGNINYFLDEFTSRFNHEEVGFLQYLNNSCKLIQSLDQIFQQVDDNIHQTCRHLNIRQDQYFTAFVYKTCKDCGAKLN